MKELIKMFYPDVERGTFPVENLNTIPASAFFSCASTATGAPNASHDWIGLQINNEADENSAVQMAFSVDSTDRYERKRTAGAWSAWVATPAAQVGVTDTANYFTGTTAETVLAEIGASLATLNARLTEKTDYGVLSGLVVGAQETPDMTVNTTAGVAYYASGTRVAVDAVESLAIDTADASGARKDIVYLSAAGVVSYAAGVPVAVAIPGVREVTLTANAVSGDTFTLMAQTYTGIAEAPASAGQFVVGESAAATATVLAGFLDANETIMALYTVTATDNKVLITEKVPGAGDTPPAASVTGTMTITQQVLSTSTAAVETAVAPTVPAGALALATIDVTGGATSIASDKITSTKRTLATA